MLMTTLAAKILSIDYFMNFALAASAALLFITLIVCWIRSGRDKL